MYCGFRDTDVSNRNNSLWIWYNGLIYAMPHYWKALLENDEAEQVHSEYISIDQLVHTKTGTSSFTYMFLINLEYEKQMEPYIKRWYEKLNIPMDEGQFYKLLQNINLCTKNVNCEVSSIDCC